MSKTKLKKLLIALISSLLLSGNQIRIFAEDLQGSQLSWRLILDLAITAVAYAIIIYAIISVIMRSTENPTDT